MPSLSHDCNAFFPSLGEKVSSVSWLKDGFSSRLPSNYFQCCYPFEYTVNLPGFQYKILQRMATDRLCEKMLFIFSSLWYTKGMLEH